MAGTTSEDVMRAIAGVIDPATGAPLRAEGVSVSPAGAVTVALPIDPARAAEMEPLRAAAEAAVRGLPGVSSAAVALTAHDAPSAAPDRGPPPDLGMSNRAKTGDKPLRAPPPAPNDGEVAGVARIIAIGSGKGGVGKSTVSANLAVALAMEGYAVGLLDADVYGPSQPRMLGVEGRPASPDGKIITPLRGYGVKVMSMGFLTGEAESVIWRGPMLMSAVTQMLHQVSWAPLDFLIIDLPPGTGDVQLSLSQKATLTGAVVVSTPQDVALLDARKAIDMFSKINVPLLGVIENMSTYICPSCGHEEHLFGHGGAKAEAERIGAPFLGEIPLHLDVRLTSDAGTPIVAAKPESAHALSFRTLARALADQVGAGAPGSAFVM